MKYNFINYKSQDITAYFTRKLNIPISHYGAMIEFITCKFQGKLSFSHFCS